MAGARSEASRIRESLATAGVPLDTNLALPLARVLHEEQQKIMRAAPAAEFADGVVASVGIVSENPDTYNAIEMQEQQLENVAKYQRQQREALARILSPQQLKVLEEDQESSLQLQRAQLRILQTQQ